MLIYKLPNNIKNIIVMTKLNPKIKSISDLRQAAIDAHHKGELDQARNFYRIYLQNCPKDAAVWSNLGVVFRK